MGKNVRDGPVLLCAGRLLSTGKRIREKVAGTRVDSAEWAAIGLLVTVGVMLLLILFAFRSRARRPPPRAVELP
jgi:hypothetical protein